jgi:hypothetical protein
MSSARLPPVSFCIITATTKYFISLESTRAARFFRASARLTPKLISSMVA